MSENALVEQPGPPQVAGPADDGWFEEVLLFCDQVDTEIGVVDRAAADGERDRAVERSSRGRHQE